MSLSLLSTKKQELNGTRGRATQEAKKLRELRPHMDALEAEFQPLDLLPPISLTHMSKKVKSEADWWKIIIGPLARMGLLRETDMAIAQLACLAAHRWNVALVNAHSEEYLRSIVPFFQELMEPPSHMRVYTGKFQRLPDGSPRMVTRPEVGPDGQPLRDSDGNIVMRTDPVPLMEVRSNPLWQTKEAEERKLVGYLVKLGCTPKSRAELLRDASESALNISRTQPKFGGIGLPKYG